MFVFVGNTETTPAWRNVRSTADRKWQQHANCARAFAWEPRDCWVHLSVRDVP